MPRAKVAREVTVVSGHPSFPDINCTITMGTVSIFEALQEAGGKGITTLDFPGWDLRHYIRVMRNKGILIHREDMKNDNGIRYGCWSLVGPHTSREIPYPKKKKPSGKRASNPNTSNGQSGGLSDE